MKNKIFITAIATLALLIIGGFAKAQFKTMSDLKQTAGKQENLKISPNPVNDNLKLSLQGEKHHVINITIFNAIGQVLLNRKYVDHPSDIILELSDFDKGLYILSVKKDDW